MTIRQFDITNDFLLNGKPVKLISGTIHYFRVVPEYWLDRLEKLKAMGCNTVETYIAWNVHEPRKGAFQFEGGADVERFIELAASLDLMVILRPGPYICAEWEFGGFPAWLLAEDGLKLRTRCPLFMRHVEDYFRVLLPRLTRHQFDRGGPVVLFQVENEYGSFGDDHAYMAAIRDLLRAHGVTVPLCTSDGPDGAMLPCGSIGGALPMANFGSNAAARMQMLNRHNGGGPLMCMEFWLGWFDAWGSGEHHRVDALANAQTLDEILSAGSVNFYMFHGGTNFGFMNGSNDYGALTPDVTSYDYDAPLSEDGQLTPKYHALKAVIARYADVPQLTFSTRIERRAYGEFAVTKRVSLNRTLEAISAPQMHDHPQCMEKLGQGYGYTLYRAVLDYGEPVEKFQLMGANDRALVFVNGERRLTLYDRELMTEQAVDWPDEGGMRLDILMENMGRVNFGPMLIRQRKGIDGSVLINARHHTGFKHWPLEMDAASLSQLDFAAGYDPGTPAFYAVEFAVDEPADTFLELPGWGKGCAILNGFNLGRFWSIGPQKRLYVPAPLLKKGQNELILFETEGQSGPIVVFHGRPDLG